jgi:tetratricopeptide (TPR) repeat protein
MSKYIPSLGFLFILTIFSLSILFIKWIYSPLSFERSWQYEQKGHTAYQHKEYQKAYKYFQKSADLEEHNQTKAYKYRCAGSALQQLGKYKNAIKYFNIALQYNKDNKLAKSTIKWLIDTKKVKPLLNNISYLNRSSDGWSLGEMAGATLNTTNASSYTLTYFSSNPKHDIYKIKAILDNKTIIEKEILKGIVEYDTLLLSKGKHIFKIFINKTFNPMKLGQSTDNRTLGINFKIKKSGNK